MNQEGYIMLLIFRVQGGPNVEQRIILLKFRVQGGPNVEQRIIPLIFRVQGGPTVEQRMNSYYNYCQIFNYILSAETPVNLELPNQWLWEIIDEFIYQFQVGNYTLLS